jgi:hypothetical protein
MPDDKKLWTYTGSTAKRKKKVAPWPDEPRREGRPRLRRKNTPLAQQRAYPREWVAFGATILVGGAFLAILYQFNAWIALALAGFLALFAVWELRRLGSKGR